MNTFNPPPLTEASARRRAKAYNVEVEVLCMACGRVAYVAEHYGHKVTRIWMKPEDQAVVTPTPPAVAWMSPADCARELMVSKMTVYRMIHSGELPAHQIGRSFRVTREAFEGWLKATLVVGA